MAERTLPPGGHWITVGGHEEGGRKHVGGHPVYVYRDARGARHVHHQVPRLLRGRDLSALHRTPETRARLSEWRRWTREAEEHRAELIREAKRYARTARREERASDPYPALLRQIREIVGESMIRAEPTEEVRKGVPSAAKRRHGVPLDEAAQALGMEGDELREALRLAEREHRKIRAKTLRDYEEESLDLLRQSDEWAAVEALLEMFREDLARARGRARTVRVARGERAPAPPKLSVTLGKRATYTLRQGRGDSPSDVELRHDVRGEAGDEALYGSVSALGRRWRDREALPKVGDRVWSGQFGGRTVARGVSRAEAVAAVRQAMLKALRGKASEAARRSARKRA